MTETLAHGYSPESTQQEVSNEYQHDRVWMVFKILCGLVIWTKVASALEGLTFLMLRLLLFKAQDHLNPVMLVLIGLLSLSTL